MPPKRGRHKNSQWPALLEAGGRWAAFVFGDPLVVFRQGHHKDVASHESVRITAELRAVDHVVAFFFGHKPDRNADAGGCVLGDAEWIDFEGVDDVLRGDVAN